MTALQAQFRRAFQFFHERDTWRGEGRARRAIALARAEREASRRGWWSHWRDSEEEGLDNVFLLAGEEEAPDVLGSMPGVRRTQDDIREAAAWLALDALQEERRRA